MAEEAGRARDHTRVDERIHFNRGMRPQMR